MMPKKAASKKKMPMGGMETPAMMKKEKMNIVDILKKRKAANKK